MKLTFTKLVCLNIGLMCLQSISVKGAENQQFNTAHMEKIKNEISALVSYAKEKSPLKLAIGVSDNDYSKNTRFADMIQDDKWIFLSIDNKGDLPGRAISINFNDLDKLSELADQCSGLFDLIVMDYSTYKFANWTLQHLQAFGKLLKDAGKFILPMDVEGSELSYEGDSLAKALDAAKTALQEQTNEGKLTKGIKLAFQPFEENKEEVNKLVLLYKEAKEKHVPKYPVRSDYTTNNDYYDALDTYDDTVTKSLEKAGLHLPLGNGILSGNPSESQLERKISRAVHEKNSKNIIFNEYVPQYNVIPLLSKVFKEVSISPIGEAILPIPGHDDKVRDSILVTATK